jgi:hypothetical protein
LRSITQHQFRNSFITLAIAGGAPEAWVRRITHNSSGDVLAGYTVNDGPAMCDAVLRIPVERQRRGQLLRLPVAVGAPETPPGTGPVLASVLASKGTEPKKPCDCRAFWTGRTGLEPAASGVTGRRYNQLNYRP